MRAGSLVTLLDAIIVHGYGSKRAAKWSKPYSGTSKAAYRNGAGATARKYIRIDDSGPGATAASGFQLEFRLIAYSPDTWNDTMNHDGACGYIRYP